ncbi:MAG TPA: hypothetical protein VN908_02940 [Gemmatimonadales bacterium]|nr:hypothetical protein [Gemmatimonadales bacterium]
MKAWKIALPLTGMVALLHLSCVDFTAPGDQANDRISIVNNPATLAAQVTYFSTPVPVDANGVGYPSAPAASAPLAVMRGAASPAAFTLTLVAEVAPPIVGGQTLQATSVSIVGQQAVVSYNMRGNLYIGAIDVFDLSNNNVPTLRSRATFQNTDISSVSVSGTNVYVAEATGDTGFASPAVFEVMQLVGYNLVLAGNRRTALSSFAGTSATATATRAYATSGDNGALFVINPITLARIDSVQLHDARWVDVAGGKVAVVQGTPGQLAVFNETTLAPIGTWSFTGAGIAQSKSTVQLVGGKAFIGAGTGGVQVLSAATGLVVGSVPRPNPATLTPPLPDSVVVTNAASVDADLLFISNGEAGVYVARGSQVFSATGSETAQTITMLGKLRFANLQSVNHVAYSSQDQYLIIAAGLGGLKMVKVNN